MQSEVAKKIWSEQQLLMINALHMFSASYFAGNVKITEDPETAAPGRGEPAQGEAAAGPGRRALVAPKRPECPPEQKQKVVNAINAYVQSATGARRHAATPSPAGFRRVFRRQLTLSAIRV